MGNYKPRKRAKGRQQGRKNLIKTETGVINQHGVMFTNEEKRKLESAVNMATRKRAKLLQAESQLPRMSLDGKPTGDTVATLQLMGRESDFILTPKTKSLQRFKTKEQYDRYMGYLKEVNKPDYIDKRIRLYKRNHMKAIMNNLGDSGIAMKIRMMKPADYAKLVAEYEDVLEIHYVYGVDQKQAKINQIRTVLGMKINEEPPIDSEFLG